MEKHGLEGSEIEGVFFTEGQAPQGTQILKELDLVVKLRQNLNPTEMKKRAVKTITAAGGNALVEMTYGQRAKVAIFANGEQWYIKGKIVKF